MAVKSNRSYPLVVVLLMVMLPFTVISGQATDAEPVGPISTFPGDPLDYIKPNNYEHLVNWFKALEAQYPNYLKVWNGDDDYGHGQILNSSGGPDHDYYFVRLTNESTGFHKPEVFYIGTPHGDETPGPVGQYWFASWILRNALTDDWNTTEDDWLNWILDNREIYFAVCHNPDGFSRVRRFDGNNYDLNRQGDYDHVPNSGVYNTGPEPFVTPNGKYLVSFIQDHQIRAGADQHSGVRMLLFPWSSSHDTVLATSKKSGEQYDYAPPDFHFYDISSLRLGSFIGSFGGTLDENSIGPVPPTVGYAPPGGIMPWAYGGDVLNNSAEDSHVQDEIYGNYHGAGILWTSPEWSVPKNPDESTFGGDQTPGYAVDVRRFLLHQTDLAQPNIWITENSIENNTVVNVGDDIQFLWKVNGCLVVDDTYIQYGMDEDPVNNFQNTTPHRTMFEGEYWGGTGWENANSGLHTGYVHGQIITAPDELGDYYFVIKAKVDQVYKNVTDPTEYGDDSYLRIVRERTDEDFTETIQGADGAETMSGQLWWYSDVVHIKVVKKPVIINFTPEDGTHWVPTDTNITVDFDLPMDHTATESAISIDPVTAGTFSWDGGNMTFDPDQDLQSETWYTVTINDSARSLLDTFMEEDLSFGFETAFSTDVEPPSILNTSPVHGEKDVPVTTQVRVFFSEDMEPVATAPSFSIVPVTSGEVAWENGTSTLVFTPNKFLKGPTDYVFTISTSAMDLGKNRLPAMRSFNFRTETPDKEAPEIVATTPVHEEVMVPLGTNITINFSEPMFKPYTEPAFSISPDITGNLTWSPNSDAIIFDPDEDLIPESVYTVTMNSTATDLYFNTLGEVHSFTFTTEDITPPFIIDTSPKDRAVDVSVDSDIIINFSEPMMESALLEAVTFEPDKETKLYRERSQAIFEPVGPLEYSTLYNVTVSTLATDMNGLPIAEEHVFSFTTETKPDLLRPYVMDTDPDDKEQNVSVYATITIKFNEPVLEPGTGDLASISPAPRFPYTATIEGDTAKVLTTGSSDPWLADSTTYIVTVNSGVRDMAGNTMSGGHTFSFTTGYKDRPSVTGSEPEDGDTDVLVDTVIRVHFSRTMNWSTVEDAFEITPTVDGSFQHMDNTLTFKPSTELKAGTPYQIKIRGTAQDDKGNLLDQEFTSDFRTKNKVQISGGLESDFLLWALLLFILIIVVAVIIGAVAMNRRKKGGGDSQAQPGPVQERSPEDTVPQQEHAPPPEPAPPQPMHEPVQEPAPEPVPEEPPTTGPVQQVEPAPQEGSTDELDDLIKSLES